MIVYTGTTVMCPLVRHQKLLPNYYHEYLNLPESKHNELKYSLKIAFLFLSIIVKLPVPNLSILLVIREKATVLSSCSKVLGPRMWYLVRDRGKQHEINFKM